ncbi:sodium/potassium-transporting ATPase subunit beta-2-like [Cimex lectularius]|uniref:Sodium/potassium-transporting ATPase subunit beta n=1 Tax=Cimex lectularius TaxID=79782 RepID=A0A8I6S069_CIMLE|nr:sodium/potassium-transporting ATPase subunit beta-2-like [Cimex lectularius]
MSRKVSPPAAGVEYEWEFAKPWDDNRTAWEKFCTTLYNREECTVLGRTPKNWFQLFVFYSVFYIFLSILFAICMAGMLATLDEKYPTWQLDDSLIGSNPGLGFRPMPPNIDEGSLIWYMPSNKSTVDFWVNSIDGFLKEYREPPRTKGVRQVCDYDRPATPGKVCDVDVNNIIWQKCTQTEKYGYISSSPCIFLKLNRIFGWEPVFYNDTNDLPQDMPDDLKDYIKKVAIDKEKLNTIWVSCHGEGPFDNENVGPIDYYPQPGFPGYYYPFQNQEGYLSPLVAVHFKNPAMHSLINIECRIWAKNAFYRKNPKDREGAVHFEILLD